MNETMRPLNNRIIVKRLEEPTRSTGGLFIPDVAKETQQRGEIIAIGEKVNAESELKIGQLVVFERYAGHEFHKMQGIDDCLIVKEDEIIAVIEPD